MPISVGRTSENNTNEAVYSTKKDNSVLTPNDFMKLFVKEMQSQDFTNPMDSSEMMNQITQFSNMQMMQSMAEYSKSTYAIGLIGKDVTAYSTDTTGATQVVSGTIDRVSLEGEDYIFYIGDKKFSIDDIGEARLKAPEEEKE